MNASLANKKCKACASGTPSLSDKQIAYLVRQVSGWEVRAGALRKKFEFKDYYHTMAFVNAVAWVAHREDHHPDLTVGYNKCEVAYSTHSVGGLSENDFICAAKVDALMEG
jgi:4a-hydroxytetrahydrobiopterin dehydratase